MEQEIKYRSLQGGYLEQSEPGRMNLFSENVFPCYERERKFSEFTSHKKE